MAKKGASAWNKFAGKYMRSMGGKVGLKAAAKAWRAGHRKNSPKISAKRNPWQKGYTYFKPSIGKRVKVGGHQKHKARKNYGGAVMNPAPFRYTLPPSVLANPFRAALPASGTFVNPKKHKKHKGYSYYSPRAGRVVRVKSKKNYGRSHKRNPFTYRLPSGMSTVAGLFENPPPSAAAYGYQVQEYAKGFATKAFLLETLAPLGVGFLGSKLLVAKVVSRIWTAKEGADAETLKKMSERSAIAKKYDWAILGGTGLALGLGAGIAFKSTDIAMKVGAGAILGMAVSLVESTDWYKKSMSLEGLSNLGAEVSQDLRKKLSKAVEEEAAKLRAGMAGMRGIPSAPIGAYATEQDLQPARNMGAYATAQDMSAQPAGGTAGISLDEFLAEPALGL